MMHAGNLTNKAEGALRAQRWYLWPVTKRSSASLRRAGVSFRLPLKLRALSQASCAPLSIRRVNWDARESCPQQDASPYAEIILRPARDKAVLNDDREWLAAHIRLWLDEEWAPLQVHETLGAAAGQAIYSLILAVVLNTSAEPDYHSQYWQVTTRQRCVVLGQAYEEARQESDELGDVLMGVGNRLLAFDFHDTFTSPFEVYTPLSS